MPMLQFGNLTLEGKSSSAVATYIRIKELDLIFDLGRCPMRFYWDESRLYFTFSS